MPEKSFEEHVSSPPHRLTRSEKVGHGLLRVIDHQLDRIAAAIGQLQDDPEASHRIRLACKRLRAIARLLKSRHPEFAATLNAQAKSVAASLSGHRDQVVMRKVIDTLSTDDASADGEPDALNPAIDADADAGSEELIERLAGTVDSLRGAAHAAGLDSISKKHLSKRYRKVRRKLQRMWARIEADSSPEEWHAVRKLVKTHLYQSQLLRKRKASIKRRRIRRLKSFGTHLGDLHDLDVIEAQLAEDGPHAGALPDRIATRRSRLVKRCLREGERLLGD